MHQIQQAAHWTDPATECSAEKQSEYKCKQSGQHQGNYCTHSQHGTDGQQRINAKEDIDRVFYSIGATVIGFNKEEEEKAKASGLACNAQQPQQPVPAPEFPYLQNFHRDR